MATKRPYQLPAVNAFRNDDKIIVDSQTNGTGAMSKDNLLKETSQNALAENVAPPFSELNAYAVGDFCIYQGELYKFTAIHSGAWDNNDVARVTIKGQFATKSAVNPSTTMNVQNMQSLFGYKTGDIPAKLAPINFVRGFTNVSFDFPNGGYYTIDTAIAAIPESLRCKGHIITFVSSTNIWEIWIYKGESNNQAPFTDSSRWTKIADNVIGHKEVFEYITKCFNCFGIEGCSVSLDTAPTFVQGTLTFPDGTEVNSSKRVRTGYIRCDKGSVVTIDDYNFVFAIFEYDGKKQLVKSASSLSTGFSKKINYVIERSDTRYIRIIVTSVKVLSTDDVNVSPSDVSCIQVKKVTQEERNIPKINNRISGTWVSGAIEVTTGNVVVVSTRIRTYRMRAEVGSIIHLKNQDEWEYNVHCYLMNEISTQSYRGYEVSIGGNATWTVDDVVVDKGNYIVVVAKRQDGATIPDASVGDSLFDIYPIDTENKLIMPSYIPARYYVSETPVNNATQALSYSELLAMYDSLVSSYSGNITKTLLGKDESNTYDIFKYEFNPKINPTGGVQNGISYNINMLPTIIIVAGTHGEEKPIQLALANMMSAIYDEWQDDEVLQHLRMCYRFVIIPCVNPWGLENNTRGNSNGVDINRNSYVNGIWDVSGSSDPTDTRYKGPTANSEKETQYVQSVMETYKGNAVMFVDLHTHGVFDSYVSMTAYEFMNITNTESRELAFLATSKAHTFSGWKNHNLPLNSGLVGQSGSETTGGMLCGEADCKGILGYLIEGLYRYYDGNVGAVYNTDTNNMNIEIIVNGVLDLLRTNYYRG